jgi:membrane protein DedA with SNARE-associated domain
MDSVLFFPLEWLLGGLSDWGYPGIFLLMAMESSLFPVPSEMVMPLAGYLVQSGRLNFVLVVASGTLGSLAGAYVNYFAALHLGRPFLLRYGCYLGVSVKRFMQVESFFLRHCGISTVLGRLLPVVRHLISLPAGLARMNHRTFSVCTLIGSCLWVSVLTGLGYFIGENHKLLKQYADQCVLAILVFGLFAIAIYVYVIAINNKRRTRQSSASAGSGRF